MSLTTVLLLILTAPMFRIVPTDLYSNPPWEWVGDVNHSGTVDIDDLLRMLQNWGTSGDRADVDCNGLVDLPDLLLLLGNWGDWRDCGVVFDGVMPYADCGGWDWPWMSDPEPSCGAIFGDDP